MLRLWNQCNIIHRSCLNKISIQDYFTKRTFQDFYAVESLAISTPNLRFITSMVQNSIIMEGIQSLHWQFYNPLFNNYDYPKEDRKMLNLSRVNKNCQSFNPNWNRDLKIVGLISRDLAFYHLKIEPNHLKNVWFMFQIIKIAKNQLFYSKYIISLI